MSQEVSKWLYSITPMPHLQVGEIMHLLTIDPNFLGHPSTYFHPTIRASGAQQRRALRRTTEQRSLRAEASECVGGGGG